MKLLLDENLSSRLARTLQDIYPGSLHVNDCGLNQSDDVAIWSYAKSHDLILVSKDSDFEHRALLEGPPAKCIQLRLGNCTTKAIEDLLRNNSVLIHHFNEDPQECVLVLP
jgi:predicted nuclease of predicted toxin-antitoxin system